MCNCVYICVSIRIVVLTDIYCKHVIFVDIPGYASQSPSPSEMMSIVVPVAVSVAVGVVLVVVAVVIIVCWRRRKNAKHRSDSRTLSSHNNYHFSHDISLLSVLLYCRFGVVRSIWYITIPTIPEVALEHGV